MANYRYPLILQEDPARGPCELRKLNEAIIAKLGVPIFFTVPQLPRPHAASASGQVYEVITGLYIVYHDHGLLLIKNFVHFCITNNIFKQNGNRTLMPAAMQEHISNIYSLRTALCHGLIEGNSAMANLLRPLKEHFPHTYIDLPQFLWSMTEAQCQTLIDSITFRADQLHQYLMEAAEIIAQDPNLLQTLRRRLLDSSFFKEEITVTDANGNRGIDYIWNFDKRVTDDMAKSAHFRAGWNRPEVLRNTAVKNWHDTIEPMFLNGTVADSDVLKNTFAKAFDDLYNPPSRSSSSNLLGDFTI